MRLIINIGYQEYTTKGDLSPLEAGTLLNALAHLVEVDTKHTPDYKERRKVLKKEKLKVGIGLEHEDQFCTEEEFEKLALAHSEKPDPEEQPL